jgi:hypothetical protein
VLDEHVRGPGFIANTEKKKKPKPKQNKKPDISLKFKENRKEQFP